MCFWQIKESNTTPLLKSHKIFKMCVKIKLHKVRSLKPQAFINLRVITKKPRTRAQTFSHF